MASQLDQAARVKLAMAASRVTMRELSERSGVPYPSLRNYLAKARGMPGDVVLQIARALNVSTDWILAGEGARLDRETLATTLELVEDVRAMSSHKVSFEECAARFEDWYNRDYARRFAGREILRRSQDLGAPERRARAARGR